ncbi:hypothetical protein ACO2KH_18725 [Leptospira terpstrae]|uniref:8-oxoguanine DNA glycosylase OGG fold protein n=1 Tax=Leptospira terpstrae TaxID=293075 RepID=UPI003CFF4A39
MKQNSSSKKSLWLQGNNLVLNENQEKSFDIKNDRIEITRQSIFSEQDNLTKLIKIIIWGYPNFGRGRNVKNILDQKNSILNIVTNLYTSNLDIAEFESLIQTFNKINSLGPSTWSKILYFFNFKVNNIATQILDIQIIKSLNKGNLLELVELKHITYSKEKISIPYINYISILNDLARQMHCSADQIEIFLFHFNNYYNLND